LGLVPNSSCNLKARGCAQALTLRCPDRQGREDNRLRGAVVGASGIIFPGQDFAILRVRSLARLLQAMMAEGALLHDAFLSHRDIRVLSRLLFLVSIPVEVFHVVRTSGHTEPAADATRVNLRDDPFRVAIGRINRTDLGAWRVVALKAGSRYEPHLFTVVLFVRFCKHLHPADDTSSLGLLLPDGRNVILGLARHHAGLAAGAAIQIDDHSPQRHVMPS
jgi:hypothetical protein